MFADIKIDHIEKVKEIYQTQCPSIYNGGMSVDMNLLFVIAVGQEYNIDYLQHLVNTYDRARVASLRESKDK